LARLRWSDEVVSGDVDEAIRLMMMSKVMVVAVVVAVVVVSQFLQSNFLHLIFFQVSIHEEQETQQRVDPTVGIFQIIRDAAILRSFPPSIFSTTSLQ
jgi:hypothetical protein